MMVLVACSTPGGGHRAPFAGSPAADGTDAAFAPGELPEPASDASASPPDLTPAVDAPEGPLDAPTTDAEEPPADAVVCESFCAATNECCQGDAVCYDFGCATPSGSCSSDAECVNDTYCWSGVCLPWGVGPKGKQDVACSKIVPPGVFFPSLQCEWLGPPPGDAFPSNLQVLGTPLVADFKIVGAVSLTGNIVFVSYAGTDGGFPSGSCCGVIRVLDGLTCETMYTLGDHAVVGGATPAIGDLDLAPDGRPEIVAFAEGGGLVAFRYDPAADDFALLWHSTLPDGSADTFGASANRWAGPTLADVTGDARPEILFDGALYGADGVRISEGLGWVGFQQGVFPVVADVDLDGEPEAVIGNRAHHFDEATQSWVAEPYAAATSLTGHIALADFGAFGEAAGLPAGAAEVAVVSGGAVTVYDLTGAAIFGPVALPGGGSGGPPTIGDFDGDGHPEVAAAGLGAYTVFDLDCVGDPLPAGCQLPGILWTRLSQDLSSSVTGSSVFDFEGDGQAEAVYGDECFTRVYNGKTGDVLFSGPRSSCTWHENPIVADVDGDFRSEIVVGSNQNCSIGCPALDPIFAGLRCDLGKECPSGTCVNGLCRCTAGQCGAGYECAAMLDGQDDGAGLVCRAAHGASTGGIRVFRDAKDRWVSSRPIWNQHAYSVTNVSDTGVVPAKGEAKPNWTQPGLNNFRQNTAGAALALSAPDLTIKPAGQPLCAADGTVTIAVSVCNRGVTAVAPGVGVTIFGAAPGPGVSPICTAPTGAALPPATCVDVSCTFTAVEPGPATLFATVDGEGEYLECIEGNNGAVLPGCP